MKPVIELELIEPLVAILCCNNIEFGGWAESLKDKLKDVFSLLLSGALAESLKDKLKDVFSLLLSGALVDEIDETDVHESFNLKEAMEVVLNEEKKKIFRARKTMKISDRQQLETLHSTLLTSSSGPSNSPPPLMNGTHKEDGEKLENDQEGQMESISANDSSCPTSPAPGLSLNLSPSSDASDSQKTKEESPVSPVSPFHSLNSELKKLESNESSSSSPTLNLDLPLERNLSKHRKTAVIQSQKIKRWKLMMKGIKFC
ncbi:hypothetical protein WMY93_006389 [Mugilogobius chulae]|uniref:Uncharacterized protein n=1 Tax=Mugilogobius chulae TaxID=88201 RepID=A0AAW0PVH2_9GOBI